MLIILGLAFMGCAYFGWRAHRVQQARSFAAWSVVGSITFILFFTAMFMSGPSVEQPAQTAADDRTIAQASDAPAPSETDGPAHPNPTPAMNAVQQRAKMRKLLAEGMSLLDDAVAVVNVTPSSRSAATILTGGRGGRFYDADRAWRAELLALNSPGRLDDNAASVALLTILAGDQAMFAGVQDALASCNEHDARLKIEEAREDYRESKLVLGGANPDNFNGFDATSQMNNEGECGG